MTNQTHLLKRGSTYYFQARIPVDILWLYDKPVKKFSLNTKDRAIAVRRVKEEAARISREFDEKRQQLKLSRGEIEPIRLTHASDDEISKIANRWLYEVLATDEHQRMEGIDAEEYRERKLMVSQGLPSLRESLAQGKAEVVQQVVSVFLHLIGVDQNIDAQTHRRLSYAFLKAGVSYFEALDQRNNGLVVNTEAIVDKERLFPINASGKSGNSLQVAFQDWKDSAKDRPAKTLQDVELVVNQFSKIVNNKSIEKIERSDVIAYLEFLINEDLNHKTVEKKINFLSAIFNVAIKKQKISNNPATGIDVPKPKVEEDARVPFDSTDLNKIFTSDLYSATTRPKGGAGEASVLLPLMALFTGARLEELAQLQVDDVRHDKKVGCHYIAIFKDGDRSVKNKSSIRNVPLHTQIIKAGFLTYLESVKNKGAKLLFPELKPDCKGNMSGNWSKWFSRYMRTEIGITDSKKVFHSFRHNFKYACREAEIPEEVHDALTGHANKSVGRGYGGMFPLKPLFNAIEKIEFADLEVPVLFIQT